MYDCPFCKIIDGDTKATGLKYHAHESVLSFVPLNPVTLGHRLFVPAYHASDAAEVPRVTGEVFAAAAAYAAKQPEDFNLIVNNGPAASQTVYHLHVHYVPRRRDDGLALPWTGQVKH